MRICDWQVRAANTLQAMPNWLTTVLLAMLLTVLTWKLSGRAFTTWRKETAASEKERDAEAAEPLLQNSAGEHSSHQHEALNDAFRSNGEPSLDLLLYSGKLSIYSAVYSRR